MTFSSIFLGQTQIQFELILPPLPSPQVVADFDGARYGTFDFSDVDSDGDLDVLITGQNELNDRIAKLYENDGIGNYSEVIGTPFTPVYISTVDFADIDGDGDQDVLITGRSVSSLYSTELFINDGLGNFVEDLGTPFDNVSGGATAFSDIDGDGDLDLLITGEIQGGSIAKLYTNDGIGNFTEVIGTAFGGVQSSEVAFSDVDGDGDQDVLISVQNSPNNSSTKLYKNDGQGTFLEEVNVSFISSNDGSIAFADIDGDGDQDVLISGVNSLNVYITKLYINDGLGIFTENINTPFINLRGTSIAFSDADNDGDQDVLITGETSTFSQVANLFLNDGFGVFSLSTSAVFDGVHSGKVDFADMNGDGNLDILFSGRAGFAVTNYYIGDGLGSYSEVTKSLLEEVSNSAHKFEDIDGDGDEDILLTGMKASGLIISKLYNNDGFGVFNEITTDTISDVYWGDVAFEDVDGDGDQDLLITGNGFNSSTQSYLDTTLLYLNDGLGEFTLMSGTIFEGLNSSTIAFADIDGDNDKDVIIIGNDYNLDYITKLYSNDGVGNFTEVLGTPFVGANGGVSFSDIDGDGDQDLIITGQENSTPTSGLYLNDGLGGFTEALGTPFNLVNLGTADFADIDGDGDEDLLITGSSISPPAAIMYENDGLGNFSEILGTPFEGVYNSSAQFVDIDGDGDQDLIITGSNTSFYYSASIKIYINNGLGHFFELTNLPINGVSEGSIDFSDIDGDGDFDLLVSGGENDRSFSAKLYRNISTTCPPLSSVQTVFSCVDFTWIDGITYTASNNSAQFTAVSPSGCDSIVTLNLTISGNSPSTGTDIITACDSVVWIDGLTYTSNNNSATHTLTNAAGCDSVVTLNLTVKSSSAGIDVVTACDSHTWIDGITYTSNNYSATDTLVNAAGCDSIVMLNLTILTGSLDVDSITSCGNYVWPINGTTYSQSGVYTESFINQVGCDSIHTLNLIIDCSIYGNVSVTNNVGAVCDGEAQSNVYGGVPPFTFLYSTGEITQDIQNLCSGVYDLSITDNALNSYQTTFVVSDLTVSYNSDSTYLSYSDSLFTSSTYNCSYDYTQPIDTFYVDLNSIIQLDQNIYQATWYLAQGIDTFIITNVYYTTQDINGSFAFSLTMYCDDSNFGGSQNRSVLRSVNFVFKTKGSLSLESYIEEEIELYPNPTTGLFYLNVPESMVGSPLILTNSVGQIVFKSKVASSSSGYSIYGLAEGVYFLQLQTSNSVITKKLKIE